MKLSLQLVTLFVAVGASLLEQQQEKLNVLGRSMLTTASEMQGIQQDVLEGLAGELAMVFVGANSQIQRIHREAGEFIKEYNMTDKYCIEVVGYMFWARALEAVEAVQLCAEEVVNGIEGAWMVNVIGEVRAKSTEVMMVVLRELARSGDVELVEIVVGKEVERIRIEWSQMIGNIKQGLARLSQFRSSAVQQTEYCTTEAIEQYDFHMGFLRYYMNKNDHCRR